jgi:Ni/Co efflux regulator RcnB
MVWTKTLLKSTLAASLAGGLLLLGGAVAARGADYGSCRRNVEKWESRLDRDIDRHGVDSRHANHDRHELREAREKCERYRDGYHEHYDYDRDDYRR